MGAGDSHTPGHAADDASLDRESLRSAYRRNVDTRTSLNQSIAQIISSLTAHLRFDRKQDADVIELQTNFVLHPDTRLVLCRYVPTNSAEEICHEPMAVGEIAMPFFEVAFVMDKSYRHQEKCVAYCVMDRNDAVAQRRSCSGRL